MNRLSIEIFETLRRIAGRGLSETCSASSFWKGLFSCKKPLLALAPSQSQFTPKYASQDKVFRRVRAAAGALPLDPAIF